jgi:hypothetical protein
MVTDLEILVADEAWVALASLHRQHRERDSFSAKEIIESAKREKAHPEIRAGLQPHINLHNVANRAPNSARYRMFYRTERGTYRLWRPGDDSHPDRKGKAAPRREELPPQYHGLLEWYEKEYCRKSRDSGDEDDPVLQMWGVGKEIWEEEGGDAFIARERAEFDRELSIKNPGVSGRDTIFKRVWRRIVEHQGAEFRTMKNLPFTHKVEGNGIWFYRNGKRIEQRLGSHEVERAIPLCPVNKTTDLKRFRDPSYLFGLLMDPRIRSTDW